MAWSFCCLLAMTPTTECLLHITLSVGLLGIQSDGPGQTRPISLLISYAHSPMTLHWCLLFDASDGCCWLQGDGPEFCKTISVFHLQKFQALIFSVPYCPCHSIIWDGPGPLLGSVGLASRGAMHEKIYETLRSVPVSYPDLFLKFACFLSRKILSNKRKILSLRP